MQARVIVMLLFALLVAVFAVMNIQPVVIDFFFDKAEIPLIFVIIVSILVGALFMFILSSMKQMTLKKQLKTLEKENTQLKQDLEQIIEEKGNEETKNAGQTVTEEKQKEQTTEEEREQNE